MNYFMDFIGQKYPLYCEILPDKHFKSILKTEVTVNHNVSTIFDNLFKKILEKKPINHRSDRQFEFKKLDYCARVFTHFIPFSREQKMVEFYNMEYVHNNSWFKCE